MIEMKDISKVYENGTVALEHVNVSIEKGEFVFIVGQSGAGKSTFIRLLFREVLPTSGSLVVNGKDVVNMAHSEVPYLRRGLGVIFQDYRLLPEKTVFENVAFAMQVIEAPRRRIQHSVNSVLDIVGLRDKYKCFPSQLSGGEQQRVAIARAIVNSPALVIADEPAPAVAPGGVRGPEPEHAVLLPAEVHPVEIGVAALELLHRLSGGHVEDPLLSRKIGIHKRVLLSQTMRS